MKNRLVAVVYVLCFLSLPATWLILEAGSGPGRTAYVMQQRETGRVSALVANQPWNPFERSAYDQAVTLWTAAADLCEATPGCFRVQIEADVLHKNTVTNVALVVYGTNSQELRRSTEFQSVRYSKQAMTRVTTLVHASDSK